MTMDTDIEAILRVDIGMERGNKLTQKAMNYFLKVSIIGTTRAKESNIITLSNKKHGKILERLAIILIIGLVLKVHSLDVNGRKGN